MRASWMSREERELNTSSKFFLETNDARKEANGKLISMVNFLISVEMNHWD